MSIWFTSDLHFFHKRICEYSGRPFNSVEDMNEGLIQNWNKNIKPTDEVWNLGDLSFGDIQSTQNVLRRLRGKHHNLIFGNHDKQIIEHLDQFGWHLNSAQYYKEINYNKQKIILFHYGMRVWSSSHHGSILLFGHSHNSLPPYGKSVDVGVDAGFIFPRIKQEDYRPIHIDEVIEYMKNREITKPDHHGAHND